jgi:hypothetical protein
VVAILTDHVKRQGAEDRPFERVGIAELPCPVLLPFFTHTALLINQTDSCQGVLILNGHKKH